TPGWKRREWHTTENRGDGARPGVFKRHRISHHGKSPTEEVPGAALPLCAHHSLRLGLHRSCLDHLPGSIVGGPLTNLFAILEIARPHFCPVLPEPFPISRHDSVDHLALCPNTAIFVIMKVFLRF